MSTEVERRTIAAIHQPWWKGRDPVLLRMLEDENVDQSRSLLRWGMWLGAIFCCGFIGFDVYLLPDVSREIAFVRLGVLVFGVAALEYGIKRNLHIYHLQIISTVALLVAAWGFLLFAVQSAYINAVFSYTIFASIFVLAVNLFFNFRFSLSVFASAAITAAYIGTFALMPHVDFRARLISGSYFAINFGLSLYLSWRLGLERYHTFVNSLQAQIQEQVAIEKGEQLKKIAETDPLTGAMNRRALSQEFANMKRHELAVGSHLALVMIDVDFFKRYNDCLGHNAGDECLIALSRCFEETAHAFGGVSGRFGGEEFLVLCHVDNADRLREIASSFCKAVEGLKIAHPDRPDDHDIVTISVGATMTENDGAMEMTALLQQADRALYTSKFTSRATYTVYDPEAVQTDASGQNLALLLSVAIERGLVSLVYQPIKDVRSGKLLGHETLMRLRDFDGTPIHPPVFIPAAEQNGAIIDLGAWAIEQALTDLRDHDLGQFVSVNVSAVQLKVPGFPLRVAEILSNCGVSAHRLALEVTEGIDIYTEVEAQRNIEHLQRLGVKVWLDDFGTGFAGLAWLSRFSFDTVKIDRSFLNECQSEQGLNLLKDMVRMLSHQNFTVLVEGVETAEQRALLKRIGVDLMQGYHLGKPMPVDHAETRCNRKSS